MFVCGSTFWFCVSVCVCDVRMIILIEKFDKNRRVFCNSSDAERVTFSSACNWIPSVRVYWCGCAHFYVQFSLATVHWCENFCFYQIFSIRFLFSVLENEKFTSIKFFFVLVLKITILQQSRTGNSFLLSRLSGLVEFSRTVLPVVLLRFLLKFWDFWKKNEKNTQRNVQFVQSKQLDDDCH